MNPFATLLAPVLLLPITAFPAVTPDRDAGTVAEFTVETDQAGQDMPDGSEPSATPFLIMLSQDVARQVSIEQRLIIRISPQAPSQQRAGILADLPTRSVGPKFEEKSIGKCVPVGGIAGVQIARENRLVFFMRDSRIVRAGLDKGCSAQDFYSGFYVERTGDGMMCSGRDKLQSRNGASCKLGKMKQLVPAD